LKSLEKKKFNAFENLKHEFLLGAKNTSKTLSIKKQLHELVISKKNLLTYYKW
jgi:hypothetical protein